MFREAWFILRELFVHQIRSARRSAALRRSRSGTRGLLLSILSELFLGHPFDRSPSPSHHHPGRAE
jgi:hypothetical protein